MAFKPAPKRQPVHTYSVKMKPLLWEKLPEDKLKGTIWKSSREKEISVVLKNTGVWDQLEEMFSAEQKRKNASQSSLLSKKLAGNIPVKELSVIDAKRAYNISNSADRLFALTFVVDIILSRIKLSFQDMRQAIVLMDDQRLSVAFVKQFLNFVPTAEDIGLLLPFKEEPPGNLAKPDMFLLEMMQVERYETRLKAMIFRSSFEERLRDFGSVSLDYPK